MADIDLDTPTFSTTVVGMSDDTARNWLFGNPIRDTLNASMSAINIANSGLLAQNQNFQNASGGAGILRSMNQAMSDAARLAKENSVVLAWTAAIVGVVLVGKALKGSPSRGRR